MHINQNETYFKPRTYIDICVKSNIKDPRFKADDCMMISKYKKSFAKVYSPIWSEGVFVIKKVKKLN